METESIIQTLREGMAHQQDGRIDDARACFDAALEQQPRDSQGMEADRIFAHAHCLMGILQAREAEFEDARASFRESLDLLPGYVEAKVRLAILFAKDGSVTQAEDLLLEVLETDPEQPIALLNLGRIRKVQGKLDEAEALLVRGVRLYPGEQELRQELDALQKVMAATTSGA